MDVPKFLNNVPNFLKVRFEVGKISYNFPLSVDFFFFLQIILNKFFRYDCFKIIYIYIIFIFSYFPWNFEKIIWPTCIPIKIYIFMVNKIFICFMNIFTYELTDDISYHETRIHFFVPENLNE